jgi:putative glutamine transport system permease protein
MLPFAQTADAAAGPFDPVIRNLPLLWDGFLTTIQLTVLAAMIALAVGTVIALMRVNPVAPLRWIGTAYVEAIRNVPLLAQLFFWVYGLPFLGVLLPIFVAAFCGLGIYTAAFVAEAIRGGIIAISKGQIEAARATGLSYGQTMRYVVLPQAMAIVVPPLGNLLIAMTKNTSVAAGVTLPELLFQTQVVNARTFATFPVFFASAIFYLALTLPMGAAVSALEKRLTAYRTMSRA